MDRWALKIKPPSRIVMSVQGAAPSEIPRFTSVKVFDVLGHRLMSNTGISKCFQATLAAMCRQVRVRIGHKRFSKLPIRFKLAALQRIFRPILTYWPFSIHRARLLDIAQRKMLRVVANIQSRPDESPNTFARRAARAVAELQRSAGCWYVHWATQTVSWAAHIVRNTKCACWPARLLDVASSSQLEAMR